MWDERAQVIAIKTAQLLNDIPIFVEPPQRSFLSNAAVDMMIFFVLLLGHLAISFIVIGILVAIHVSRNARPGIKPPMALAAALLFASANTIYYFTGNKRTAGRHGEDAD